MNGSGQNSEKSGRLTPFYGGAGSCFAHLDRYVDRTALICENGERLNYAYLLGEGGKLAAKAGRRCLAFILSANSFEPAVAYTGFLRAGIVPLLLSRSLDAGLLENLLQNYRPAFIFLPESLAARRPSFRQVGRLGNYVLSATGYEQDYDLHDELALLLTTSGSTGSPKLVRQSYLNIKSNTESIIEYLDIDKDDRAITTLPMHYTYGLSIINTHLWAGAALILTEAAVTARTFWDILRREEAHTFGGVPYIYEMLKKLRFSKMDLPSLRYLTQAGGRLAPELLLEFCGICRERGWKFVAMYGQTEATARMAWLPWERAEDKNSSIGLAIPGGRLWLSDEKQEPIETACLTGELVYDGANVTLGYAENRYDLAKGDERGGRLFTGDMAERDEDGFYYLTGRKKRFLKLFGSRVNLDEIESLLKAEGFSCACCGKDDNLKIYLEDEKNLPSAEAYLSGKLAINRAGFKVLPIKSIPRNEAGKVLYAALPGDKSEDC